jgi:hypothetical protein
LSVSMQMFMAIASASVGGAGYCLEPNGRGCCLKPAGLVKFLSNAKVIAPVPATKSVSCANMGMTVSNESISQ